MVVGAGWKDALRVKEALMVRMEIHPGEGGGDAALFASELAHAVSVYAQSPARQVGRIWVLDRL